MAVINERSLMYCDLWISKFKKEQFQRKLYEEIRYTYFQVCYVILEPFAGLIGATMVFLIYFYSAKLVVSEATLGGFGGYSILNLAIAIHISGWIIQLIGHAIFEGMISRF